MSVDTIWTLVTGQGGIVFLLLVILWAGKTRVWVWGHQVEEEKKRTREAKKEVEEWTNRFLQAMGQASKASDLLHRTVLKEDQVSTSEK